MQGALTCQHHFPTIERGYIKLYIDHVLGADKGADLDFLVGNDTRVPPAGEPLIMTANYSDLKNKSVFVTGGGSGIGAK